MSINIVSYGGPHVSFLARFASNLIKTATNGAVTASTTEAINNSSTNIVACEVISAPYGVTVNTDDATTSGYPVGVHTCIVHSNDPDTVQCPQNKKLYGDVEISMVRAVLPRAPLGQVALRDTLDVLKGSGNLSKEVDAISASFNKSTKVCVSVAQQIGSKRAILMLKQQSVHSEINELFVRCATETLEKAGVQVEIRTTSDVMNKLLVLPDHLAPLIFTNDVLATDSVLYAFAGIVGSGGAVVSMESDNSTQKDAVLGGYSMLSIGNCVVKALANAGMRSEAKAAGEAVQKMLNDNITVGNAVEMS